MGTYSQDYDHKTTRELLLEMREILAKSIKLSETYSTSTIEVDIDMKEAYSEECYNMEIDVEHVELGQE